MSAIESGRFSSEKLRFFRDLKGESLKQVSDDVGYSVTTLSKWEKGRSIPNFSGIMSLSKHFNVDHHFFLSRVDVPEFDGPVFFRKAAVLPKRKVTQAQSKEKGFAIVDGLLTEILNLPTYAEPSYANKSKDFEILSYETIDRIADNVRSQFNLGDGPIANMTLIVERMGIRVKFSDLESEKIDAVTGNIMSRPYILLNSRRLSSVRLRFNLAHELGHILLHAHYPSNIINSSSNLKTIESEANHFAGALLMPDYGISLDMIRTNMSYIIELKKHWKVAIQALVYRGNEMGLISDSQALFLRQTIYRNKWRINEPLDDEIPIERPSYIQSAIKFSNDNSNYSLKEISRATGLSIAEVNYWLINEKTSSLDDKQESGLRLL
ncbi:MULTISPECIES: helix-turn-helix domain-containing protein [Lactiplantibacillus]|uniref:ImmA/IrrE family metallo-endopeptidase n=2 Tax=Bacillati TaxID=1783272 RepID=A0ABD7IUN0_LACPE|nr:MULTISPECIES: XRE family transcriptional regulator [Lactiplantibacillus]KZU93859.1 Transcriptional regulator XRE family [Lactiplantibacillus plantarum]RMW51787.1 ImmA/IrrE family metallo-endopeptidase [Lactiplantibacillus pentosus]